MYDPLFFMWEKTYFYGIYDHDFLNLDPYHVEYFHILHSSPILLCPVESLLFRVANSVDPD